MEEEGEERFFPVRGTLAAWLTRALRKLCLDGLRSVKTLASHSPSLRSIELILLFG